MTTPMNSLNRDREEEVDCPKCNGVGWTAEHDSPNRHGEYGECLTCPIQVQCEDCQGIGKIIITTPNELTK